MEKEKCVSVFGVCEFWKFCFCPKQSWMMSFVYANRKTNFVCGTKLTKTTVGCRCVWCVSGQNGRKQWVHDLANRWSTCLSTSTSFHRQEWVSSIQWLLKIVHYHKKECTSDRRVFGFEAVNQRFDTRTPGGVRSHCATRQSSWLWRTVSNNKVSPHQAVIATLFARGAVGEKSGLNCS